MKKIAGDKHSTTFQHKDGHRIMIAHAKLPQIQQKQLQKLPIQHFVEGGKVGPYKRKDYEKEQTPTLDLSGTSADYEMPTEQQVQQPKNPNMGEVERYSGGGSVQPPPPPPPAPNLPGASSAQESMRKAFGFADGGEAQPNMSQMQAQDQAIMNQPSQQDIQNKAADILPNSNGMVDTSQAYQQGQQAVTQQGQTAGQLAQSNVAPMESDLAARTKVDSDLQGNLQRIQANREQAIDLYKQGKIDPNHYQQSMGSTQKMNTAIGMFLGGIGGALTHQGNPAVDFMNKQIDRDIDAQKMNMDKTKNLVSEYSKLYGDTMLGAQATRISMNDILDHQIQTNAAKLGTQNAANNAMAAHSQFAMQNANAVNQMAIYRTVTDAAKNNGGAGLDAIDLAHAGMIDQGTAEKEQASINGQKTAITGIKDIFSRANNEQTTENLINPQSYARMKAINAELTNLIVASDASKRLTPVSAAEEIKPFMMGTGNSTLTREQKMQGVLNVAKKHFNETAPTPHMQKYAPAALPNWDMGEHPLSKPAKMQNGHVYNWDAATGKYK